MPGYLQDQLWILKMPSEYSPKQVAQYMAVIGVLPSSHYTTEGSIANGDFPKGLETLSEIVKGHLVAFPFENTAMHYTETRKMDVSAAGVFQRLVVERKGSFCFGQNTLLLEMLRGLGFRAYAGAARVNMNWQDPAKPYAYGFQSHMVVFVQPFDDSTETYVVDVGFGGSCPTRPIPLMAGAGSVTRGAGPNEVHRLVKEPFAASSLGRWANSPLASGQDAWSLEVLHTRGSKAGGDSVAPRWKRVFTFTEQEFFPLDCEAAAAQVVASIPLFIENVLCIKYVMDPESDDGYGDLCRVVLTGREVKLRKGDGETEVVARMEGEEDRVRVLREVFGIEIGDGDVEFVKGTPAALA